MNIDRDDASITLTEEEGNVLLGNAEATPKMLADKNHPNGAYKSFRDKVEHRASELSYETERTVLVFMEGKDEEIAILKDERLEMR